MAATKERLGTILERLGKNLQSRERPPELDQLEPMTAALQLWESLAPGRKPDPKTCSYLPFILWKDGVEPDSPEKKLFKELIMPYIRSVMFQEMSDPLRVSLSINPSDDADVSFKLTIWSPSDFPYGKSLPILVFRELPERHYGKDKYSYDLLVLGEGHNLYSQKLDQILTRFDVEKNEFIWEQLEDVVADETEENVSWRKQFTVHVLQYLTQIVREGSIEATAAYDREVQLYFKRLNRGREWWKRLLFERQQLGAVSNDDFKLSLYRQLHCPSSEETH